MTRREELKSAMRGGGTAAPARRGRKRAGVGRARPASGQGPRAETRDAVSVGGKMVGGSRVIPAGGKRFVPNPKVKAAKQSRRGKGRERIRAGLAKSRPARGQGKAGVADRAQAGLGRQLTRRVESGAISQEQAQQTAAERAQLAEAYGPDWRAEVFGDRGYMQRTRLAAEENPDDPQVQALLAMLLQRRREALARAMGESAP